jgi:tRNA(Arg) A34 adenosine deaminase TadA
MNHEQALRHLKRANEVAKRAATLGRHPFGAILVAPDGETVLAEQGNIDTVHHAEATLARTVSLNYSREFLWDCTLVTTFEPCAMCTGTAYWANIGHIVYGASEETLLALTGNSEENPTLSMSCRQLIATGQKKITVEGPYAELEEQLVAPHVGFWKSLAS